MFNIDTKSFLTAKENMEYDKQLAAQVESESITRFFRVYEWKKAGITQSEKRAIPPECKLLDQAFRITGGGVVFHSPGDIVFSSGASINDTLLPVKLKQRCLWFATIIKNALNQLDIPVELAGDESLEPFDINYCSTYHNPFECKLGDQKVCGIALKKTRKSIIFQGVIHVSPSQLYFDQLGNHFFQYFTKGCYPYKIRCLNDIVAAIQQACLDIDTL